jgi:hypothetical protein
MYFFIWLVTFLLHVIGKAVEVMQGNSAQPGTDVYGAGLGLV